LWLDADQKYLFSEISCLGSNPASGEDVKCWKDRSGNDAHVKETDIHKNSSSTTDHGEPQYQHDDVMLNGKPYVLFKKNTDVDNNQNDALAHENLPTRWEGAHSLFLVVQQIGNMQKFESYFSNGKKTDPGSQFQVSYITSGGGNLVYTQQTGGTLKIGPPGVDQTRIYTIRNDDGSSSDKTTTYIDGEDTIHSQTARPQTFTRYLIGLNRNVNQHANFGLAELVLYDRALDNGELSDVHEYLATKYGISSEAEGYPVGRLSWEQLFPSQ
jgi:hypothetical protein